ncbi:MAG: transposase [Proteobacteria bacterium]|nr:transposase [Pseudomonadota bacterium]
MTKRYTESFKIQAVEKVLSRTNGTTIEEISNRLGVGLSTIVRWVKESREQKVGSGKSRNMTKESRPQDLSLQERLNHIKSCASLDESAVSIYCRENGIYPHHIEQWELDFVNGNSEKSTSKISNSKKHKTEINTLKKEVRRKDKALAETAALLVLQKKVHAIWGNDEDS